MDNNIGSESFVNNKITESGVGSNATDVANVKNEKDKDQDEAEKDSVSSFKDSHVASSEPSQENKPQFRVAVDNKSGDEDNSTDLNTDVNKDLAEDKSLNQKAEQSSEKESFVNNKITESGVGSNATDVANVKNEKDKGQDEAEKDSVSSFKDSHVASSEPSQENKPQFRVAVDNKSGDEDNSTDLNTDVNKDLAEDKSLNQKAEQSSEKEKTQNIMNDPEPEPEPVTEENVTKHEKQERKDPHVPSSELPQEGEPQIRENNKSGDEDNSTDLKTDENKDLAEDKSLNQKAEQSSEKEKTQNIMNDSEPEPVTEENVTKHETQERKDSHVPSSELPQEGEPQIRVTDNNKKTQNIMNDSEPVTEENVTKHETQERKDSHVPSSELPQEGEPQIRVTDNNKLVWGFAFLVLLASVASAVLSQRFSNSALPVAKEHNVVDVFNQEMDKLKIAFPNQRSELWRRSLIHLRRHLKTAQPTEPVSLILTAGHRAERTLGCLAQCLAQAFSTAHNSSVLNIDGKIKASQDSDQVKLDIDHELKTAFDGKKFAAVIHRFEELPPGSTLIFYRYCDHENAAYKNVFLAFTVMLEAEVEVQSNVTLGKVEEMVQEHVKLKFVSSEKSAVFDQMDVDKLSGLWSRISHLILPVTAEDEIEQQGCEYCDKSF